MNDASQPAQPQLNELLRRLPQVEAVLQAPELAASLALYRRDVVLRLIRAELEEKREWLKGGRAVFGSAGPSAEFLLETTALAVVSRLGRLEKSLLRPVINGTGVLIHTNLGRAVLSQRAQAALLAVAGCYSNLELELESGERTRRDITLEPLLLSLTGAPAATVVNNNASAVYLILHSLAGHGAADPQRREVITSRGELVEIGGSYRVPDMLRASGCELIEVGTTNRTRLSDYEAAISPRTGLLLKTHPSNYRIRGFTQEVSIEELVALGKRHGIPVYYDLGSGYLAPEPLVGLGQHPQPHPSGADSHLPLQEGADTAAPLQNILPEPDVISTLASGVDLLSFSGDKLLGGPQAGIVLGSAALIKALRASALWRVLRIDKFTASALGATLLDQLRQPQERSSGGLGEQYAVSTDELHSRAETLAVGLREAVPQWRFSVLPAAGSFGGGSLPEEEVPSFAVSIEAPGLTADALDGELRRGRPAIVGVFAKGVYALNVLTLLHGDAEALTLRLSDIAASHAASA